MKILNLETLADEGVSDKVGARVPVPAGAVWVVRRLLDQEAFVPALAAGTRSNIKPDARAPT